jgi:hypothetical protein
VAGSENINQDLSYDRKRKATSQTMGSDWPQSIRRIHQARLRAGLHSCGLEQADSITAIRQAAALFNRVYPDFLLTFQNMHGIFM